MNDKLSHHFLLKYDEETKLLSTRRFCESIKSFEPYIKDCPYVWFTAIEKALKDEEFKPTCDECLKEWINS